MILALDISLNTGFAMGSEGKITFGTRIFSAFRGPGYEIMAGRKFREWLDPLLDEIKPKTLVIERPFFRGDCTWLLVGMAWEAQRAAEMRGIPCFDYQPSTIKKFLAGDGRAQKPAMVQAARLRGYKVTNDHEADAIALLLYHEKITRPVDKPPARLF